MYVTEKGLLSRSEVMWMGFPLVSLIGIKPA